jgi:hypothetical protein
VLELAPLSAAVIACLAAPAELDRVDVPDTLAIRTAPDELLLVAAPERSESMAANVVLSLGETALVIDQSDAFAGWTLRGADTFEAFARLSAIPLPSERPTIQQGLVGHVPAKILAGRERLDLLVPSTLAHHIRKRVLAACADLAPEEGPRELFDTETHVPIEATAR